MNGRAISFAEHKYKISAGLIPEGERTLVFFNNARVDGLERRVETPLMMTENFIGRDDFLVYRHVEYGVRQKKFGPAAESSYRPIEVRPSSSRLHAPRTHACRIRCLAAV